MRRLALATLLALTLTALGSAAAFTSSSPAGSTRAAGPQKLTIWVGWSAGHELTVFKQVVAQYNKSHSDVNWNVVGGIVDAKILAAIRSGTAPDVVSSFNSYNVGNYCGTGGWIDLTFQRLIEVWTAIPSLYLLLILSSVLVPGFFVLLGILLLFSWVSLVGLVRAEFLRGRNFEYIQAARALGVSNGKIMFRHLLPNAMVATMTFLPFIVSSSVMTLTALDFLGFGLPPGSPSLGELLSQGKANVQAPWLGFTGFFSVAIMLSLLIFIGEAARDAFDPRKTFR